MSNTLDIKVPLKAAFQRRHPIFHSIRPMPPILRRPLILHLLPVLHSPRILRMSGIDQIPSWPRFCWPSWMSWPSLVRAGQGSEKPAFILKYIHKRVADFDRDDDRFNDKPTSDVPSASPGAAEWCLSGGRGVARRPGIQASELAELGPSRPRFWKRVFIYKYTQRTKRKKNTWRWKFNDKPTSDVPPASPGAAEWGLGGGQVMTMRPGVQKSKRAIWRWLPGTN